MRTLSRWSAAVAAGVVVLAGGIANVGVAHGVQAAAPTVQVPQVSYYRALIRNSATLRCLSTNAYHQVFTTTCASANTYQQWRFDNTALQFIWNVRTGRCLAYDRTTGSHTGAVSMQVCNRSNYYQLWRGHITGAEFTYYGSRCLDSNAQGVVYTLPGNGSQYQIWQKIYFSTP